MSLEDLARDAWRAETVFVGVPCGIMDQFACALGTAGHALHIWCDTEQSEQVPFTEVVLVFDTGVQRSLRGSEFQLRRTQCDAAFRLLKRTNPTLRNLASATRADILAAELPDPLGRRALHVCDELDRVRRAVAALRAGEPIPGEILYESHESLRLLFDCSTPELDWFVDQAARVPGVRGARLTGAGWGGCAIAMGDESALLDAADRLPPLYQAAFGHTPRCWLSRAGVGARVDRAP
jgi:galactokinase